MTEALTIDGPAQNGDGQPPNPGEELVTRLQARIAQLELVNEKLRADIGIIARKLVDQAVKRDWCGEYDDFVDECNADTSYEHLEHMRFRERGIFQVTVDFTYERRNDPDPYGQLREALGELGVDFEVHNVTVIVQDTCRLERDS